MSKAEDLDPIKEEGNLEKESIQFEGEAKEVLDLIEHTDLDLFITGKAGTGKSTLLNHICQKYSQDMAILAPTGIAALNIHGDTIHSFFRLKPGYELDEAKNVRIGKHTLEKLQAVETILIDEISMVRADILDAIDVMLRRARRSEVSFGGVRMLFFGDLFQLPPTLNRHDEETFYRTYKTPYFFSAAVFIQKDFFTPPFQLKTIELTKVYRQKEYDFIEALNAIRTGQVSNKELELINKRTDSQFTPSDQVPFIHLVSTNRLAYSINNDKLNEIDNPFIMFNAIRTGKIGKIQPNADHISVKVGAQVMFINNDSSKRWVNGTIGVVVDHQQKFNKKTEEFEDTLIVKLDNGKEVKVKPFTWEISQYVFKNGRFVRENLGSFTQIPLKLAWAITIHKSQGKSFNHVIIDLGTGSFAHGQTYVALSRCRTLKGLVLKSQIQYSDIIVDDYIVEYFKG